MANYNDDARPRTERMRAAVYNSGDWPTATRPAYAYFAGAWATGLAGGVV